MVLAVKSWCLVKGRKGPNQGSRVKVILLNREAAKVLREGTLSLGTSVCAMTREHELRPQRWAAS